MIDAALLADAARAAGLAPCSAVVARVDRSHAGERAELDAHLPLYPASMIKVPIACAAHARIAEGTLDPASRVRIDARNLTVNDAPSPLAAGYRARVAELIDLMLARSDNVATNQLIDLLGRDTISAWCARAGLGETHVRRKLSGGEPLVDDPQVSGRNAHPAADAAALFIALDAGRVPGHREIVQSLERQWWNGKLTLGLQAGDRFAHKTGDTSDVSHDGGILRMADGRRYVVVVYTGVASPDEDPRFGLWMRLVRTALIDDEE